MGKAGGTSRTKLILGVVLVAVIVGGIAVGYYITQPKVKDTLVFGTTDSVQTTLDPANAYDFFGLEIVMATGAGLVEYRAGGSGSASDILPALATSWTSTDGGMVWTFSLRHGVLFDDGTEFNATHVKYSVDRGNLIADPDGSFVGIGIGGIIKNVTVVDKYTVRFFLNFPFSAFLSLAAYQGLYMVDPKYGGSAPWGQLNATTPPNHWVGNLSKVVQYKAGDARSSCPMGLGPYRLTEWTRTGGKDQSMRLDANPNYWNATGGFPKTKTILIKFYADATTLSTAIQAGDVDIAFRQLDAATINYLKTVSSVKVWEGTGAFIQYLVFRTSQAPFDNKDVRQGVAACLNRSHVVDTVFLGAAAPLFSMIPNGMAYHEDSFKSLANATNPGQPDYTLARELLAKAGYNEGNKLTFKLWYEASGHYPQSAETALVLKSDLEGSGVISITLDTVDWTTYKAKWKAGEFPAWIMGWYPDYLDPDDYIQPFYDTSGASWLVHGYSNSTMDQLILWARGNTTDTVRNGLYSEIQDIALRDCPIAPIYQAGAFAVSKTNVFGIYLDITQNYRHWLTWATA